MKIILAFDSFKGSLTVAEAVEAAHKGVLAASPDATTVCLPLADGGEGTTAALVRCMDASWRTCPAHDARLRPITAHYAISSNGQTAVMEMAVAAGLTLLADEERDPMKTSTYGVGEMMLDAARNGCTQLLIGIGGSATNDGGTGMLEALGVRFTDKNGKPTKPVGGNLGSIADIDWSGIADLSGMDICVICDVQNPLYGSNGAARIFAPQKGAGEKDAAMLDENLQHLVRICEQQAHKRKSSFPSLDSTPQQYANMPGSGAAGGLGYGLLLLGAKLLRGTDAILDTAQIDTKLHDASLVITGEGKIDKQTLCGKLPFGVLQRAKKQNIRTIALAGKVEDTDTLLRAGFHAVCSITPPEMAEAEAMRKEVAMRNLATAAEKAVKEHLETKRDPSGTTSTKTQPL